MSTSHEPLTEADIAAFQINPEIMRYLEAFRAEHGLPKHRVRVLDWGCGRGQTAIVLERQGWDAVGADIHAESIRNGRALFADARTGEERLRLLDANGRLRMPDQSFDFVFSETVLEHVAELDAVVAELDRLMSDHSASLHVFPARRAVMETHLYMPFIHWLPKNRWRKWAMVPYVALGIEPRWVEEPLGAKVQRYYDYSCEHTFYRRPRDIRRAFERRGFEVTFVAGQHPKVTQHPVLGRAARSAPVRALINAGLTRFRTVELLARKHA